MGQGLGHLPRFTCCPRIQKIPDRSNVISEVPKCSKIQIFRGATPNPLTYGEGARCLLPRTPSRFRPRFYSSQGLTHYRVGNPTNDRFQKCIRLYEFRIFSVSKNGENGLGDEGLMGAMPPPEFLGYNRPCEYSHRPIQNHALYACVWEPSGPLQPPVYTSRPMNLR